MHVAFLSSYYDDAGMYACDGVWTYELAQCGNDHDVGNGHDGAQREM